jgi:hypothetical protein
MNVSAKSRIQNAVDTIPRIRPASARPPFGPPSFPNERRGGEGDDEIGSP